MSIQYLKGTKPERIWCLLYSRMIAATLIFTVHSIIARFVSSVKCELSLPKFVNWLKRNGRFATLLLKGFTSDLWCHLIEGLELLVKDWQRRRKTTQQMLEERIPFLDIVKKTVGDNA